MEYDTIICSSCVVTLSCQAGSILSHDMHDQHRDRDELFQNVSSAVEKVRIHVYFLED